MAPYGVRCEGHRVVLWWRRTLPLALSAEVAAGLAAALVPHVSDVSLDQWKEAAAAERRLENEQGKWSVFVARALRQNMDRMLWGPRAETVAVPNATTAEQMLRAVLSPSKVTFALVGGSDAFADQLAGLLAPLLSVEPAGSSSIMSWQRGAERSALERQCTISHNQHSYGRTETFLALEMPLCLAHPSLMRELLMWRMFRSLRSFGAFTYYAATNAMQLDESRAAVSVHWLQGSDFPVGNVNRTASVEWALSTLAGQTAMDLDAEWNPVYTGWLGSLELRRQSVQFYFDSIEITMAGHHVGLNLTAPLLSCTAGGVDRRSVTVLHLTAVPGRNGEMRCS